MRNRKLMAPIVIFMVFSILMLVASFQSLQHRVKTETRAEEKRVERSHFININYNYLSEGIPKMYLKGKRLDLRGDLVLIDTPMGYFYDDEARRINFQALDGSLEKSKKEMKLKGDVYFESKTASHFGDELYYNGIKSFLEVTGNVKSHVDDEKTGDKLDITSNYLSSWPNEKRHTYVGNVVGKLERKKKYESGLNFEAQKMLLLEKESLINLEDRVRVVRNNYKMRANRAEIYLENYNKKLKYLSLYDDIKLEEELKGVSGKKKIRRAYSERLENFVSEGKILLSGAPKVEQGDDVIKGYQITLRENVELVEVDDSQSSFKLKKE